MTILKIILIRVIFYYIGMTLMFPYMMLINITDFWNYKLRNTSVQWNSSDSSLNSLQMNFPSYLAITGNVPLALFVILSAIWGYKIHLRTRLLVCSIGMVICFIVITFFVSINTDQNQDLLFIIMLVINTIYSSINAIAQVCEFLIFNFCKISIFCFSDKLPW